MNWLQLFVSLSLLIILHEGGHFLAARMFKTRVEKFYLFFDFLFPLPNVLNFSLFKFKKGDTEYGLGWFPLGGYVKIAGMADESQDKDALAGPPQPWEFRSKKAWQRLIIILGGIIVNIITGILIFWGVKFTYGDKYVPLQQVTVHVMDSSLVKAGMQNGDKILGFTSFEDLNRALLYGDVSTLEVERNNEKKVITLPENMAKVFIENQGALLMPRVPFIISGVADNSPNKDIAFKPGDKIVKIDGTDIQYVDQFAPIGQAKKNQEVTALIENEGQTREVKLKVGEDGKLGIGYLTRLKDLKKLGYLPLETTHYGFFEALPVGINASVNTIVDYARQFKLIFKPSTGAYKEVGGFIGMSKMFPETFSWEGFWLMTGILSLILAFMNFLPIPMLDGGYMIFILWEMITGKEPNEKFMNIANNIGFFILIGLMLYANGNDIIKLFTGK
ncbi:MAG: RIP metalloprotease RseP [Bacteroidia bacterium]|nr:RIP metalloprotease RseP [Bacteroidia bacterium]